MYAVDIEANMYFFFLLSSEKVTEKTPIPPPDWEALISLTADEILAERSPARLLQVRARLYDLLTHCIPPTTILKVSDLALLHQRSGRKHPMLTCLFVLQTLTFKLIPKVDDALKPEVIKWSAFYEHRVKLGSVRIALRVRTLFD